MLEDHNFDDDSDDLLDNNYELDQLQIKCDHYFDELRKDQTKINTCVHCGYEEESK